MADKVLTNINDVLPSGDPSTVNAEDMAATSDALDALLKEVTEGGEGGGDDSAAKEAEAKAKADADKKAADEKAEADRKAAEAAAADPEAAKKQAEEKAAADKKAAEEAEAWKAAGGEDIDKIELPPYTKPKSREAFDLVKSKARAEVVKASAEARALREKIAELEKAAKEAPSSSSPEEKAELEELRSFRRSLDIEFDPSFKKWDEAIAANTEAIYAKLKASGTSDDVIEEIKKMGGPQEVAWEKMPDGKIPNSVKKYIEGKLFQNEDLSDKKKEAIEAAKKNAGEFLSGQAKQVETEYNALVPHMEWMKAKVVDPKSKPEEKAAVEAHNKLIADIQEDVKAALGDNSPKTRAILIAGFAQLRRVRHDLEVSRVSHKSEVESLKAAHKTELDKISAELKEKVEYIERIKKSSPGRSRDSSAPPAGAPSTAPKKVDLNTSTGDALDALLAEAQAAEAAKQ